ncbi:MAG: DUF5777 family beta-barrel protein [Balneolaceae bacterium]
MIKRQVIGNRSPLVRGLVVTGLVICFTFCSVFFPGTAEAQLPRERVETDALVNDLFWAPTNIGISTVQNIAERNLTTSIAHAFGPVDGGINRFFGLDDGANTRLGLEYGLNDRLSLGLGRMTFNKVVDIRGKANFLRQTERGHPPIDLATKVSMGISTLSGAGLEFSDRLSYLVSIMVARKFDRLSMQLAPMASYFNSAPGNSQSYLYGVGVLAQYEITSRFALSAEYLPVLGDRNQGTADAMGIALNIDTGGHVFQIFFTSSQWHNEQYIMAGNRDRFWEGDMRFGFNIHRVFGL